MQTEEATLRLGRSRVAEGSGSAPAWNHAEFAVRYRSLESQLCVGGVYVKLLLDGLDKARPAACSSPAVALASPLHGGYGSPWAT